VEVNVGQLQLRKHETSISGVQFLDVRSIPTASYVEMLFHQRTHLGQQLWGHFPWRNLFIYVTSGMLTARNQNQAFDLQHPVHLRQQSHPSNNDDDDSNNNNNNKYIAVIVTFAGDEVA
jgi:hypothetical protein